jgi:hypothetical protein
MQCPYCQQEHSENALFCPLSGGQLIPTPVTAITCPNCAQPLAEGLRYCTNCGFDLQSAQPGPIALPAAEQPVPDDEQRRRRALLWLLGAVAVLLALCGIVSMAIGISLRSSGG